jgi:hypothetical protein
VVAPLHVTVATLLQMFDRLSNILVEVVGFIQESGIFSIGYWQTSENCALVSGFAGIGLAKKFFL